MKWNETRRIGAIFASLCVARVCQRQLGYLVLQGNNLAFLETKLQKITSLDITSQQNDIIGDELQN